MNKIKKVWIENKVLFVLAIIFIICIIVFTVVSIKSFYGSSNNVYGNRLDMIEKVPLKDSFFKDIKENLESKDTISKVDAKLKGKIVYIEIEFNKDTAMDKAKKEADSVLEFFSEDELNAYDIQVIISSEFTDKNNSYTLMGARNSNGSGSIVWSNYNIKESSAE